MQRITLTPQCESQFLLDRVSNAIKSFTTLFKLQPNERYLILWMPNAVHRVLFCSGVGVVDVLTWVAQFSASAFICPIIALRAWGRNDEYGIWYLIRWNKNRFFAYSSLALAGGIFPGSSKTFYWVCIVSAQRRGTWQALFHLAGRCCRCWRRRRHRP